VGSISHSDHACNGLPIDRLLAAIKATADDLAPLTSSATPPPTSATFEAAERLRTNGNCRTCYRGRCANGMRSCKACLDAYDREVKAECRRQRAAMLDRLAVLLEATREETVGLFAGIAQRAGKPS